MPRKHQSGRSQFFSRLIYQALGGRSSNEDRNTKRRLKFESLEGRLPMASDLGAISGMVTVGGTAVPGANINLYSDDGDGIFEGGGDDGPATTVQTNASGIFRFDQLAAGDYWLEQPDQTVGSDNLGLFRRLMTVAPGDADGVAGTVLDDFADSPAATVTATDTTNPNSLAADHGGAIGGERDMIVTLKSGTTTPSVTLTSTGNQLIFDSSFDAQGTFNVIYDGNDDDALTLAATGLGSTDLTQSGVNTAVKVRAQADQADTTVRLRIYTDATNFSDSAPVVIPGTNTPTDIVFHFANFTTAGGTGADFSDVGAIDLLIDTNTNATDGMVTLLGAFAPVVLTQNIENEIDLALTKGVDEAAPTVNSNVTFTITVSNPADGPQATGVQVTDLLPAGLAFVSSNPEVGTYNETSGIWSIGAIESGDDVTLEIVATVTSGDPINNTATISAVDQGDPDTNNNTDATAIDAVPTADLSLTKDVDNASPALNSNVTFTITLTNSGPDEATGVQVLDQLPAGLTFVSATPSVGSYNETTGVWDVGTVINGATPTLAIVATVTSGSAISNIAQVSASDVADNDSTPNNNEAGEDDQDSVTVDAFEPASADLSLDKQASTLTPNLGQQVTFTLTLANSGPDEATGVQVTDLLPAGLAFVSSNPSVGTYNGTTGVWDVGSVASGASPTLEIVATVTSTAAIVNDAEVTASGTADPDSTPNDGQGDDFASVTIDAPPAADLSVTVTADDTTPDANQQVTFTIVVTNGGPDQATGVVVTDLLPAGLTYVSDTPSAGTYDETTGVWTVGTIDNGDSETLTIVVTVTGTLPILNSAEVTAVNEFDPDSTPNDGQGDDFDSETLAAPPSADLSLDKQASTLTPNLGQQVTFTLTLTNSGPDAATAVQVTDQLPAGLTFVSATPSSGTYNSTTGVWDVGTVNSGAAPTLEIVAMVTSTAAIVNNAEVTASGVADPDSTPNDGQGDDFDTVTIDAPPAADLSIGMTASNNTPALNSNVTFTITLTNSGPDAATGVQVIDQLPAGLTFVSSTPSVGTYNNTTGVWDVGTVASGAAPTLQIVATVTSSAPIVNSAQVSASGVFDPDSTPNDGQGDDFASQTIDAGNVADLSLTMTPSSTTPNFGSNVTFTLTLTNSGPDAATGVQVTDLLPGGLTFVSSNPSVGTYNSTTGVWDVGTVNSGAAPTLQIVATVNSTAAITNTAQVTASGTTDPDSTPGDGQGDDFATVTIDAPPAADLSVTLTPSSTTPNFGSNVTFTITVSNAGPDQATGVVVTDLLPSGLVFVSSTPSQGSYVSSTGVWTVGSINSGATATLSLVARVNSTAAITNSAQVTAAGVFDPDSTPNDGTGDDFASATIDAPNAADLRLAKTLVGPNLVNVGQNLTFRLTLTNDGPDAATGVTVRDLLAAGLTFVSAMASQGTYNSTTGDWTVGDVANGASLTLDIVATLATAGAKTNTAEVTVSGTFDPDSTPNDNTGDDRATVTVGSIRLSKRRFLARD
jgi:large repetitive protein